MPRAKTRRDFLQKATAAGVGFWVTGRQAVAQSRSANEKLNIAIIGVEGQGGWNLNQLARTGQNIVALCDAHESRAAKARRRFPKARFCADFRGVVDRKDVDAVLVATPDHVHAAATMAALRAGKHVYCEKPLTHTVFEARQVADMAARMKRVTQMGTQIHAGNNYRRVVELIESKAIGAVREVHVWVGKAWVGHDRPTKGQPTPPGLNYDLWIGPAPHRPYHEDYLPMKWRGWWDFGGGTLADMACHYCDLPFWALKLNHPKTIEADGPKVHPESAPARLRVSKNFTPQVFDRFKMANARKFKIDFVGAITLTFNVFGPDSTLAPQTFAFALTSNNAGADRTELIRRLPSLKGRKWNMTVATTTSAILFDFYLVI